MTFSLSCIPKYFEFFSASWLANSIIIFIICDIADKVAGESTAISCCVLTYTYFLILPEFFFFCWNQTNCVKHCLCANHAICCSASFSPSWQPVPVLFSRLQGTSGNDGPPGPPGERVSIRTFFWSMSVNCACKSGGSTPRESQIGISHSHSSRQMERRSGCTIHPADVKSLTFMVKNLPKWSRGHPSGRREMRAEPEWDGGDALPFICLLTLSAPSQFKGPQGPQGPVGLPGPKGPNVSRCCQSVRTLVRSNKLFKY